MIRAAPAWRGWLASAAALALLAACGPSEKERTAARLSSASAKERAAAVAALGALLGPRDTELWVRLEKAAADPAAAVRAAAAGALRGAPAGGDVAADERGATADAALARLLADPDDAVRVAAAEALGGRCGPRAIAHLETGFGRSGASARAAIAAALQRCGRTPSQILARAEELRRRHAVDRLGSASGAQRAAAARELGLLGREEDVKRLLALLDERDGAVAAAAAAALGSAGAREAAPRLGALVADPQPAVAAAAAQALLDLGPEAARGAREALAAQAVRAGAQALPCALALVEGGAPEEACALAREALDAGAAALLARGCPAGPLWDELGNVAGAGGARLDPGGEARALPLLEALGQAAAGPAPARGALALGRLCERAGPALARRAAALARSTGAREAGPALVAVVRRERAALARERAALERRRTGPGEDDEAVARDLRAQGSEAPAPDAEKLTRLFELLEKRGELQAARAGARERLAALLAGGDAGVSPRDLLAEALRAALSLGAPGAAAEARALAEDPDPALAAAARGEPAPAVRPAPAGPKTGPRLESPAPWSDVAAERIAGCGALRARGDAGSLALLAAFASSDPEARVRTACAAKNETGPQERR